MIFTSLNKTPKFVANSETEILENGKDLNWIYKNYKITIIVLFLLFSGKTTPQITKKT